MQYRKFGKTGVEVSALGFGAMRLPTIGGKMDSVDEKATEEMLRYAIEHGVNYVDTAYVYHGGAGEKAIGKILKRGLREKVNLATKLPTWMVTSRKDMDRYLNEQLERLQTDHIDFYLAHGLSKERWSHLESLGFIDFIEAAKKDGRITYAGFSYHDEPQNFRPIVDACRWDFCQIQFNFMDTAYQAGLKGLRYAGKKGLGLVIMEPLKGGQLTGSVPPAIQKVWARAKV
jgi:predicted aldo/keto reductase-like oxidoreductase